MKAIIPVLTEGMIDVWRVGPTDPVDYLADYIFKKSNDCQRDKWRSDIINYEKGMNQWGNTLTLISNHS